MKSESFSNEFQKIKDQAIETSITSIAIGDLEGKLNYVNDAFLKMWGFSDKTEVLERSILEFLHNRTEIDKVFRELQTQSKWIGELVAKKKDDTLFHVLLSANMVFDDEGVPFNMISSFVDITERKKMEGELRLKNQAIETSITAISMTDLEGKLTYANHSFLKMWGFSTDEEVLGRPTSDFSFDSAKTEEDMKELQTKGKWEGEAVAMRMDGTTFNVLVSANIVFDDEGVPIGTIVSFLDITERKKYEEELRKSEHALNERAKEITTLYEISKIIIESEKTHEETFNKIVRVIPPAWQYPEITIARIAFRGKEYSTSDFKESKWKLSAEIIIDGEKQGELEVCYSEEKREEDEGPFLKEERDLIDAIANEIARLIVRKKYEDDLIIMNHALETSPMGLSISNPLDAVTYVNPAFMKMWGFSKKEEVYGKHHSELIQILGQTHGEQEFLDAQKQMKKEGFWKGEFASKTLNGTLKWINMITSFISDEDGNRKGNLTFFEEITNRRKHRREKEEAYRKIEELNEQLTVINTILEHDIRNNLVITNGSIDAFLDSNKESFLHMAKKAATKSENLINKMKEVVEIITKGGRELEEVNVRNIAEEIISTYAGIGIQFDLKGKGSARADVALGSVIDNIISNALKHSETDTISITIKSSKESCVIEIADNGKGIPDDFKKKLFEHGFRFGSTAGTGLGLYIVKKTIEQYGGSIKVKNNLPKGTIFEIELKKA